MGVGEDKYNALRKRLDQLGYRHTLDMTTVPLVEKLFADLLHTTDSLKTVKQQTAFMKEESQAIIQQGDPYKAENTRLLRENNDLHIQLIKVKEDSEGKVKELKNALRKSEHGCADLQFLNSQYAHKLKALQKQDQAKSDRIQQLHERNMNAVVETPGGRRRHMAPRRPVLEIESPLPGSSISQTPQKEHSDPYMCDLLRVADQQIAELNRQVKNMEEANAASQRKVDMLAKQVSLRDKEIDRLQHLLEGGRPTKAMLNDGMAESTERVISHLNIQVEYLQQTNRELDAKLRASLAKQREDMESNKGYQTKQAVLKKELETVQGELDKMRFEKEARLGTYETELDLIFSKIQDKENQANEEKVVQMALQDQLEELKAGKKELVKLLTLSQVESEKFTLVVRRLEEDKKEITRQHSGLREENKQLKRNVSSLEHITSLKTTNIEQQKNFSEVNLQEKVDALTNANITIKNQITIILKELEESQTELTLKSEEMTYYKQECANLQSLISKYAIPARDNGPLSQVEKISADRDRAKEKVSSLQIEVLDLRSSIRHITSERDNIDALYLQTADEVKRLRTEKTEHIIAKSGDSLKLERDNAISKLKQALSDKDALSEQLTIAKQTSGLEHEQVHDKLREQERKCHSLTVERDLLGVKANNFKETIRKLEERVTTSSTFLYTAKAGQSHSDSQIQHLKTVATVAQRSRDELHNKLSEVSMELELSHQRNNFLEKQVSDLQDSLRGRNTNTLKMKQTLVDKEKDQDTLLGQLDEKTEKIHEMNHKFLEQENELQVLTIEIKSFEDKFREQKVLSSQKESEALSLRKQVNRLVDELSHIETTHEVTLKNNKQLTQDVANMTSENQRLNEELKDLTKELELMRRHANEKAQELHNIEHMIGLKDADCQEILSRYKELSAESQRVSREAKLSTNNCHSLQRELAATSDVRDALEIRLKEQVLEIQNVLRHTDNLEQKISDMELQLNEEDMMLRNYGEEKREILLDLDTVREINTKIECQREAHARNAANRSVEVEQLQRVIESLTSDCDSLKRQVSAEKDCVRNLEFIIHRGRQQEYENQTSTEGSVLKVQHLEASLQIKGTELKQSTIKYKDLCNDFDNLKEQNNKLLREITHERFEREKAKNESSSLKHRLEIATPAFGSAPGTLSRRTPHPVSHPEATSRAEAVSYEHTLSPSSIKHPPTRRRSSNEETDDSIMRVVNRTLKFKTVAPSNAPSIMTSMTDTSVDNSMLAEGTSAVESSIDSIAFKIKTGDDWSGKIPTRQDSADKAMSDVTSDMTFDGDEDDSVYQAIRSSQRGSSRQS